MANFQRRIQLITRNLIGTEHPECLGVPLHRIRQQRTDRLHRGELLIRLLGELFPVAQVERRVALVRFRDHPHSTFNVPRDDPERCFADESLSRGGGVVCPALGGGEGHVDEFVDLVALEPVFEQAKLFVVFPGLGQGHLMASPVPFNDVVA